MRVLATARDERERGAAASQNFDLSSLEDYTPLGAMTFEKYSHAIARDRVAVWHPHPSQAYFTLRYFTLFFTGALKNCAAARPPLLLPGARARTSRPFISIEAALACSQPS